MNRALARLRVLLDSGRRPDPGSTSAPSAGTDFSRPWHRAFLATFAFSWTGAIALALLAPTSRPLTSASLGLILLGSASGITLLIRSIASSVSGLRAR